VSKIRRGLLIAPNAYSTTSIAASVMSDRITFDPKIMGGLACIRGMRIPVSMIVSQIAMGASFDDVSREYPDLEKEDTIKR